MCVCVFAITVDDRGMMNRAAAAMVTLEMRSDELARFLVATIGTSSHSTDAIARSFELRDPAVLLVWLPSVLVPPSVFACRPSVFPPRFAPRDTLGEAAMGVRRDLGYQ